MKRARFGVDAEAMILSEIADKRFKRDDVAVTYWMCLEQQDVHWSRINAAIIARWSKSGLIYIKTKAWNHPPVSEDFE